GLLRISGCASRLPFASKKNGNCPPRDVNGSGTVGVFQSTAPTPTTPAAVGWPKVVGPFSPWALMSVVPGMKPLIQRRWVGAGPCLGRKANRRLDVLLLLVNTSSCSGSLVLSVFVLKLLGTRSVVPEESVMMTSISVVTWKLARLEPPSRKALSHCTSNDMV